MTAPQIPSQTAYDRSATLTGQDPVPFGKFGPKGTKRSMRAVPNWYWKWFLDQDFARYWPAVQAYAANRLCLAEVPTPTSKTDTRPKGPAQPPTAWQGPDLPTPDPDDIPF